MLSIQDVGMQIFEKRPLKFYVFCGSEYGIKHKYLDMISEFYGSFKEIDKVSDIFELMSKKQLIPLKPSLYIVRYDEDFISKLNSNTQSDIDKLQINGTVVCIYESEKHTSKISTYLPNYSVSIDNVNRNFLYKYLKSDFTDLIDRLINVSCNCCNDYSSAKLLCNILSKLSTKSVNSYTDEELQSLFHIQSNYDDEYTRLLIASKNYKKLFDLVDSDLIDIDNFIYSILSTLIELEKVKNSSYLESKFRQFSKLWSLNDIYNMFMISYRELKLSRSLSIDILKSVYYLITILSFSKIPDIEVLS